MKKLTTTLTLIFATFSIIFAQTTASLIGVPGKNDRPTKLISTADGGYLMAGQVDNDAALYRFDCNGILLDSIRKDLPAAGSFEIFNDVVALPNGNFVAVGEAVSTDGTIKHGIAILVSPNLAQIKFDTFFVNGKSAAVKRIVRRPSGELVIAGVQLGVGLDFGDAFCANLNATTMRPSTSISVFGYGIDEVRGLSLTAAGDLLVAGYSVLGNIFDVNASLTNIAWVRAVKNDGSKKWDFRRNDVFTNKYGRAYFEEAIENPQTGHILAGGTRFLGDTSNALDPHFQLFDKDGNAIDSMTLVLKGGQNINEIRGVSSVPFVFLVVGDSTQTATLTANFAFPFFALYTEIGNKIQYVAHGSDPAFPLSIQSALPAKNGETAIAGTIFLPPGVANNQDILISLPSFAVSISQNGNELFAAVEPTGNYQYQWIFNGQPLAGQNSPTLSAASDGIYTVVVTDVDGCSRTENITVSGAGQISAQIFEALSDTICAGVPLLTQEIINDAESYQWDFGNGVGSQQPKPVIIYSNPGTYQLKLTAKTSPGQYFVPEISVLAHEPYFSLTDPEPDIYFILKNSAGAEVYRSEIYFNATDLPLKIPCAVLLTNSNYVLELWDYDLLDTDDALGYVFLANPTAGGTFSFGGASVFFQTSAAGANYVHSQTITVLPANDPKCTSAADEISNFENVKIYPVPLRSGDDLQIDLGENAAQIVEVQLVDAFGRVVEIWRKPEILDGKMTLKTAGLGAAAGVYFLNFRTAEGKIAGRRVIFGE